MTTLRRSVLAVPAVRGGATPRRLWLLSRVGAVAGAAAGVFLLLGAQVAAAAGPCGAAGVFTPAGSGGSCAYATPGTEDTFTVPAGVGTVSVTAVGAKGGADGRPGGSGAVVSNGGLPVAGGATLYVDVGAPGSIDACAPVAGGHDGGAFDGGDTGWVTRPGPECARGGASGGASSALSTLPRATAVLTGNAATDSRLLVAGGGGGSGDGAAGGNAGNPAIVGAGNAGAFANTPAGEGGVGPTDGTDGGGLGSGFGGTKGTASRGGTGNYSPGSFTVVGPGGGGGWFGGGGGFGLTTCCVGAAGGGSSYGGAGAAAGITVATATTQPPSVTISWVVETTAPLCVLSGFSGAGNQTIHVMVGDTDSGLASIVPVATNATAPVPAFTPGSTAPLDFAATKIDTGAGATLKLTVTDVAGNVTVCDPVVPGLVHRSLHRGLQRVSGLTAMQSAFTIRNGRNGLTRVVLNVNGTRFSVRLPSGVVRTVDVLGAMRAGHNRVTIESYGRRSAAARLTIGM